MNCANAEIKAGYGETVITPPSGVELCGYGYYLQRACQSVHDDLKARALCVTCGDTVLFLIVCDLIGLDIGTTDNIRQAIAAEHNIRHPMCCLPAPTPHGARNHIPSCLWKHFG